MAPWKVLCQPAQMEGWRSYFGCGLKGQDTSATAAIPAGYVAHAMVSLTAERKEQTPHSESRYSFFPSLPALELAGGRRHSSVSSSCPVMLPCLGRTAELPEEHPSLLSATGKENTGPVTAAWQEQGMEPSLWDASRSLCEQQPHTLPCSRKWHLFPFLPWERTANIPCPVPPHLRDRVKPSGFPFWICFRECFHALECGGGWEGIQLPPLGGREWIMAQTAWQHLPPGEKGVGDAPQGFLGMFLKPSPSSEPPAVICCPRRPLCLLLSSPPGFSPSLLGPVVSWCFSSEAPGLPKPPCPLISLSLPCRCSGLRRLAPAAAAAPPHCHPGGSHVRG